MWLSVRWMFTLADSLDRNLGLKQGDSIEVLPVLKKGTPAPNLAQAVIGETTFEMTLTEEGLRSDIISPLIGPAALQISVYHQKTEGPNPAFRAFYGTAIKKDPQDIGVWGAEEDDSGAQTGRKRH